MFTALRVVKRVRPPHIVRVVTYRPGLLGMPCGLLHNALLRGESAWSVAERELFAAHVWEATPDLVGPDDLAPARAAGVSQAAIVDAVYICAEFSLMNRVADALGCEPLPPRQREARATISDGERPGRDPRETP